MKTIVSAGSACALALLLILSLTGCGGVRSASAPAPTPTPLPPGATPTPTPAAAHGTFIFVNGDSSSGEPTDGYRLNADGTLTLISGSPFPVSGGLAASGGFLMVSTGNSLTSYKIDPATGVPTKAASVAAGGSSAIAADTKNVYVAGVTADNANNIISGFSVASSGALTPVSGSPYVFSPTCLFCDQPVSLAVNNNFLAVGGVGFHSVGDFTVYPRSSSGVLGKPQGLGGDEQGDVAIQHPTGNAAFAIDGSLGAINSYHIDSTGKPVAAGNGQLLTGNFMDEVVDATGKFLLLADLSGVVNVFTIDPASANISQIGTSESTGSGAILIAMDPSGRFVIVAQSSFLGSPTAADQITVFTFDPATGAMKKLQSYPVGKAPGRITIVSA